MYIRGGVISAFRHRNRTHIISLYDKIYESVFHFHHIKPELDAAMRTRARNHFGPYLDVPYAAKPQEVALKARTKR